MENKILKTIVFILILLVLVCCSFVELKSAKSEGQTELLRVTATLLNGRLAPGKKNRIEARFDEGDILEATGEWNKTHTWVEVKGGENGTVWCDVRYVNALEKPITVKYDGKGKVKIRKAPVNGQISGYLKPGKEIEIVQSVLGWGRCSKGWIDLDYLTEE